MFLPFVTTLTFALLILLFVIVPSVLPANTPMLTVCEYSFFNSTLIFGLFRVRFVSCEFLFKFPNKPMLTSDSD